MGNSSSSTLAEQVYRAAKAARRTELEDLARRSSFPRLSDEQYVPWSQLLEWEDSDGQTALLVAARNNDAYCVNQLLWCGANVHHQSRRGKRCGSALHLAAYFGCSKDVIDPLLRFGASPFVENIVGLTPLDYGLAQNHAHIVRQFESHGLFGGYLNVKRTSYMGLKSIWSAQWVAVTPRWPYPNLPRNQQNFQKILRIYPDAESANPTTALYLDGSRTRNGQSEIELELYPDNKCFAGGLRVVGCPARGHPLKFQPAYIIDAVQLLDRFANAIKHFLVAGRAPKRQSAQLLSFSHILTFDAPCGYPSTCFGCNFYAGPPEISFSPANNPVRVRRIPPGASPYCVPSTKNQTSCAPSAPRLPAHSNIPPSSSTSTRHTQEGGMNAKSDEDEVCVICLENPKEAGFVHGSSIHMCCCVACARSVMESGNKACSVCRQEVEHLIEHVYT